MYVVAIIAAGGYGSRLGAGVPKQFLALGGTSIIQRTIHAFARHARIDEIVTVLPAEFIHRYQGVLTSGPTPMRIVPGGPRRQDSVANGFAWVPIRADLVVIHDAARPFVAPAVIDRTLDAAHESGAALAAVVARETVKLADLSGVVPTVDMTLPRDTIFLAQTPQAFRREVLQEVVARERERADVTDEAMLAERAGRDVRLVEGDARNIKITTEADLTLARALVGEGMPPMTIRIGVGYDLHRLAEGRPLILGGVAIPHARGLEGHSDADVVCHAVVDALLGAAAAGDIGRHFPTTDDRWRGVSSLELLERARIIVGGLGWAVENVDVVVIAERPAIGTYLDEMRARVARAAGVDPGRVSIKGKTNEGVDGVGHGDAIAAHAVALVRAVSPV